ncbi:glycoside hydrolase family 31 protein [Prevotella sp. 10(H)]|uniref:glycoside hydrolase family 31 protein n=1 Tax=Prevotella sp. 10(H) TaxID=1158294 RepID=UPI0004A76E6F|nr:glycoside hydrolase family 31 protein [Prevotella sp. 10(H)]
MKKVVLLVLLFISILDIFAQEFFKTDIPLAQDEYWWGGAVAYGAQMPYLKPVKEFNLALDNNNNQVVPLFLSNKGRYLWSEKPFFFEITDNTVKIKSEYEQIMIQQGGSTLREAYITACQKYFPPTGTLPDELFFTMPQYNTWIELMYNQNQEDILKYAQSVIDNNFPRGVLMIDDNWQQNYGNFDFRPDKFPDPKGMIDKLHNMGFKVILWICPFVSADSKEYRELLGKGYLIKRKGSWLPAIINWWNGQSACYDLTNPDAFDHFTGILKKMQQKYGVDGFKLDAGDNGFYNTRYLDSYKKDATSVDHTFAWMKVGLEFPFNEYRAGWKMGGQPLVQRLGDKHYSYSALQSLIPEMIAAGLLGYAYTCPDMIGGGQISSFVNLDEKDFNQNLIVRSAQVHALMPMMQFSVAPWRVLDKEHMDMVREMADLHQKFGGYIINCARESAKTGEPIVRHMEYAFPNEGFAECKDQFMLGDKYLVAPVITKENSRTIKLPKGKWRDDLGKTYKGGQTITMDIPLNRLVYFEKQ